MKDFEFYKKYANTPLSLRHVAVNFKETGTMTLNDIHTEIKTIDNKIRADVIRKEKLIRIAAEVLEKL